MKGLSDMPKKIINIFSDKSGFARHARYLSVAAGLLATGIVIGWLTNGGWWQGRSLDQKQASREITPEFKPSENTGKFAIKPIYADVHDFSDGLAAVRLPGGKFQVINKMGETVFYTEYDNIEAFSEGLAVYQIGIFCSNADMGNGKCDGNEPSPRHGYIDINGKVITPAKYLWPKNFSGGRARVALLGDDEQKTGYIDRKGELVILPKYYSTNDFKEGVAAVYTHQEDASGEGPPTLWGLINKDGKLIFNEQFTTLGDFSEGLAYFSQGEGKDRKNGYVDISGRVAFTKVGKYIYYDGEPFSEGLARISVNEPRSMESKTGFIDKNGVLIVDAKFNDAWDFSEGLAAVTVSSPKKWGFIDRNGDISVPLKFDDVRSFKEGLAPAMVGNPGYGKWGFIDRLGNFVIPPQFDFVSGFSGGLAVACIGQQYDTRCGYIRRN